MVIMAIIPFTVFWLNSISIYKIPDFANQYENSCVIEISDYADIYSGIYFVKAGTKSKQFLSSAGIDVKTGTDFKIEDKMKLTIVSAKENDIILGIIDNYRILALGMKISINHASYDDLLLISGIGEVTAEKIIKLRNKKGYFRQIDELMEISGIKEKKLAVLKKYLTL